MQTDMKKGDKLSQDTGSLCGIERSALQKVCDAAKRADAVVSLSD